MFNNDPDYADPEPNLLINLPLLDNLLGEMEFVRNADEVKVTMEEAARCLLRTLLIARNQKRELKA